MTVSQLLREPTKSPKLPNRHGQSHIDLLWELQHHVCYYCARLTERDKLSVDHKTPRSRGGGNKFKNKVGCCKTCNGAKANMTFGEFLNTDYLAEDRRRALGCDKPAGVKFKEAQRQHEARLIGRGLQIPRLA